MCQTLSSTCCHVNLRVPVITASTVGPLKTVAPDGKRHMEASRTLLLLFRMGLDPGAGKLSLHFLKVWGLDCCRCFGGRKKRLPEWPSRSVLSSHLLSRLREVGSRYHLPRIPLSPLRKEKRPGLFSSFSLNDKKTPKSPRSQAINQVSQFLVGPMPRHDAPSHQQSGKFLILVSPFSHPPACFTPPRKKGRERQQHKRGSVFTGDESLSRPLSLWAGAGPPL